MTLLVEVLGGGRRRGGEDDGLQFLEHAEAGVEQAIAARRAGTCLPGVQRALEPAPHLLGEPQVLTDGGAHLVGRQ